MVSAVGAARMLVIPVCPLSASSSDGTVCDSSSVWNYNRIDGDFMYYFEQVVDIAAAFYDETSDGQFDISATTIIPETLAIEYNQAQCNEIAPLGSGNTFETLAKSAARNYGYDPNDYDMEIIVIPHCEAIWWEGWARVARRGIVLNLRANTFDSLLAHEIGHNLGLSHGACTENGARGADAFVGDNENLIEYCNPFAVLGSGNVLTADILMASKFYLGWIDPDRWLQTVSLWNFDENSSTDTIFYYNLASADTYDAFRDNQPTGTALAAVRIQTETTDRFYYIEHRHEQTGGSAALVYWVEFQDSRNDRPSRTILVDTTPGTSSWRDAALKPGDSVVLDLADDDQGSSYLVSLKADINSENPNFLTIQIGAVIPTSSPVYSPTVFPSADPTKKPITLSPTLQPTPEATYRPTQASSIVLTPPPSRIPTTLFPSAAPTTREPTSNPTTSVPYAAPTTVQLTTVTPSTVPTTPVPSSKPTTPMPTPLPSTEPSTTLPSPMPTTLAPSFNPTTSLPTLLPSTEPSTSIPSATSTTLIPTITPTTYIPTPLPSTEPSTSVPSASPTTLIPTSNPSTLLQSTAPTAVPTTSIPTSSKSTLWKPTVIPTVSPVLPSYLATSAPNFHVQSSPAPSLIWAFSMPTQSSSNSFACAIIADGDTRIERLEFCGEFADQGKDDSMIAAKDQAIAGTRCCGASPANDTSVCDSLCEAVDYDTAKAQCEKRGLRLCTEKEILVDGRAEGTGCAYDVMHVWTSNEIMCALLLGPSSAPSALGKSTFLPSRSPSTRMPSFRPIVNPTTSPPTTRIPTPNPTTASPSFIPTPSPASRPTALPTTLPVSLPSFSPPSNSPSADPLTRANFDVATDGSDRAAGSSNQDSGGIALAIALAIAVPLCCILCICAAATNRRKYPQHFQDCVANSCAFVHIVKTEPAHEESPRNEDDPISLFVDQEYQEDSHDSLCSPPGRFRSTSSGVTFFSRISSEESDLLSPPSAAERLQSEQSPSNIKIGFLEEKVNEGEDDEANSGSNDDCADREERAALA